MRPEPKPDSPITALTRGQGSACQAWRSPSEKVVECPLDFMPSQGHFTPSLAWMLVIQLFKFTRAPISLGSKAAIKRGRSGCILAVTIRKRPEAGFQRLTLSREDTQNAPFSPRLFIQLSKRLEQKKKKVKGPCYWLRGEASTCQCRRHGFDP